ncbi:synaptopodin-2 [Aulostomus maculatus]
MEPEAEDQDNADNLVPWSGSDGSQELSKSLAESYNEDNFSDEEYPLKPQTTHIPKSEPVSPEPFETQDWESAYEQRSLSEDDLSFQEDNDIYLCDSRESTAESPHIQNSLTSKPEHPNPESHTGQINRQRSQSSSSSLGCADDMTLALTLSTEQPRGASDRQGPGIVNRRVDSSGEGGSTEAPPASVFFGISDEGAEQAERWNSESDTDLCRRDRHRARCTRLSYTESQSERHVKETKSKCKRIARLLTDAPNPQNKGALLFKKRRQRVKKYTLVSYGTGESKLDSEDQIEEEAEEVRTAGYNFVATNDSDLEEEYSVYHQQNNLSLNWGSVAEMDALPETKGKGVMMFAQRRKRMDEIMSEHEELRGKGLPVEALVEPRRTAAQQTYDAKEMYVHSDQDNYTDTKMEQMILQSNVSRPMVPNRTARPFLGVGKTAPVVPGGMAPATKMPEARFKVPVPIISSPQVWSPTGDIIASRDERISVPAIKTGIPPELKRRGNNKQRPTLKQDSHLQNTGERKSYIESEEDCFSLGAEACNFMQPRTVKLKNPPPVAPKPTINPSCPPWMKSPSAESFIPPRSPVSNPSQSPVGPHLQHFLQQQDWAQPQQMANRWAPDQAQATFQTPASSWAPLNSSTQLHLQPTANSWSQQLPQSPVSMQARNPTYSSHHPPPSSRNKPDSEPHSVASFPPQERKSYILAAKASNDQVSERGISRVGDNQTLKGKGADLFAKRQTRMEKFVVGGEKVQASKVRPSSPTSSLPNTWRYSSNVRAPPPLSYNPLLSPFHPPSALKKGPSTAPKIKTKEKPKVPQKHLNALDIMKHQPYQLNSSLFKYDAVTDVKSPSPSPSPKPTPPSKFEVTKNLKHRSALSHSSYTISEVDLDSKSDVPAKSSGSGFGRSRSLSLPRRLDSVSSAGLQSPVFRPGTQPSFSPAQRQTSFQEAGFKPLTPWEAAAKSPIGSVEEAFLFQSLPTSVAASVKAAGHRRSLPDPPDEWKRRVSLDPVATSQGHYHAAPGFQAPSLSRTFSPERQVFYGPPFRPAQPLRPASRASIGYMGPGSSLSQYSPMYSAVQRS